MVQDYEENGYSKGLPSLKSSEEFRMSYIILSLRGVIGRSSGLLREAERGAASVL